MKNYIYTVAVILFSFVFTACDYNERNFEGLEELSRPTNVAKYNYTLTSADITAIVAALNANKNPQDSAIAKKLNTEKMFSQELDPAKLIPYIFPSKYPGADVNSSVVTTYQYNTGRDTVLTALSTASSVMADADYKLIWGDLYVNSFTPAKSPQTSIPVILDKNLGKPKKGTFANVEYYYSEEEPVTTTVETKFLNEDLQAHAAGSGVLVNIDGWINKNASATGTIGWQCRAFSGNNYAQVSANGSKSLNDAWLVTKSIDLTKSAGTPKLSFDIAVGYYNASCLTVLISENFDGNEANILSATWKDISASFIIPTDPASGYGTISPAGTLDLSSYKGKKIYVAFRYQGDDTSDPKKTTTYQIDNIKVSESVTGIDVKEKSLQYVAYMFDGNKWVEASSELTLQPEDYTNMGLTYLTTVQAPNYLPTLLAQKQPFAQEGKEVVVVYKTSRGNNYADRYTYTGGKWTLNNVVETRTDQFVLSSNGWIFDPTIVVNFQTEDYQVLVDYVLEHQAVEIPELVHANKNAEYYYGFGSRYRNISYRDTDRTKDPVYMELVSKGASSEEKTAFLNQRTIEGFIVYLNIKYSDLTPQANGADQYVLLSAVLYDGSLSTTYSFRFQRVDTPEKWKFIDSVHQ